MEELIKKYKRKIRNGKIMWTTTITLGILAISYTEGTLELIILGSMLVSLLLIGFDLGANWGKLSLIEDPATHLSKVYGAEVDIHYEEPEE